ncbi:MAG: DUF3237 family protein [Boseongicola sp. SB0677_bin_26]|nr:DUF3237 family protein [Boseongicola sp. SB0665_bin_10]MYG25832.1 DUF3237 family protein [Boseongicola sp. SB0677_bin_26]
MPCIVGWNLKSRTPNSRTKRRTSCAPARPLRGSTEGNQDVVRLGADWQTAFADGLAELDTRYATASEDGATIEIMNDDCRHGPGEVLEAIAGGERVAPKRHDMRTHARHETGDERFKRANRTLFVGTGARRRQSVQLRLFALR